MRRVTGVQGGPKSGFVSRRPMIGAFGPAAQTPSPWTKFAGKVNNMVDSSLDTDENITKIPIVKLLSHI